MGTPQPLPTTSGVPLSELGLRFLIAKQAKHKTIDPTPDVVPMLAHFDRAATTEFALALFDQWLASPQVAADRWEDTGVLDLCAQHALHVFHDEDRWPVLRDDLQILPVKEVPLIVFELGVLCVT